MTTSCSTSLSLSMLADMNCCDRVQLGQARNWRSFHSREMGTQWSTLRRWYIRQKCSSGPCSRTWSYPQTGLTNRLAVPIQALEILLQKNIYIVKLTVFKDETSSKFVVVLVTYLTHHPGIIHVFLQSSSSAVPTETCLNCWDEIPLNQLRDHLATCQQSSWSVMFNNT